jgi:hypothetical protein
VTAPWWDSASVGPFREVALRFTGLIDAHASRSATELLHAAHALLPQLYGAALVLPVKPEEAFEDITDDAAYTVPEPDHAALDRHHARWRALVDGIATQLGPRWTHYQEVFDPYASPPERPVTGSLADDFADIYLELAKGEETWQRGDRSAAVWEWRFGFESHWGEHVIGALRALRALAADHDLGFPVSLDVDV